MTINIGQIIGYVVNNFPIFLMIGGLLFFFFTLFNVEIRPPKVEPVDKITKVRVYIIGVAGIIFIVGLIFYTVPFFPHSPAPPTAKAVNSPTNDFASNLIPAGQSPTINDPLKDNSQGYGWDEETLPTGSCHFIQGQYVLSASAGNNNGIGCNTENANGIFSNFVYQIQMTILTGLDNDQSGAGPTFRVNTSGNGQQYQVTFDVAGDWEVETGSRVLTSISTPCNNPCSFFHKGVKKSNVITISAIGSSIEVQINGHTLGSYVDSTSTSGYIGVQLSPGTANSSVTFSNVRVWNL